MHINADLRKLVELDQHGAFTDAEVAAAKAAVIARSNVDESAIEAQIAELRRQKREIEQLDLQWEVERRNYEFTGRFSERAIPTRWGSVINMIAIVIFGICWVTISMIGETPFWFPWFGALVSLIGLVACAHRYRVAGAHDEAYERYQRRREALLDLHDEEI